MVQAASPLRQKVSTRIGLVLCMAVGALALLPSPALAATLTVSSTVDVATNFGACGSAAQTTSSGSLREAICAANNAGATSSTITVAAGTYHLTNGELQMGKVPRKQHHPERSRRSEHDHRRQRPIRIFDLDPNLVGAVTTSISGVTISGGSDSTFGGAGIIAGSSRAAHRRPVGRPDRQQLDDHRTTTPPVAATPAAASHSPAAT